MRRYVFAVLFAVILAVSPQWALADDGHGVGEYVREAAPHGPGAAIAPRALWPDRQVCRPVSQHPAGTASHSLCCRSHGWG
ncbi:MAG: hypothetical protein AB1487_02895 [Thermodesulfobacteriota bacterium]